MFGLFTKSKTKERSGHDGNNKKDGVIEVRPDQAHVDYKKQWDSNNRPIGYIIGVTPGFAQFAQGDQKLVESGLARKVMKGARLGFDFVEIDFEALGEINEHKLKYLIDDVKRAQGVEIGIHGPVTDRIALDLGVATGPVWELNHRNLQRTMYTAADVCKGKFIIFHTSRTGRPNISHVIGGDYYQGSRGPQFSFTGETLGRWIMKVDREAGNGGYKDPCYDVYHGIGSRKYRKDSKHGDSFSLKDWFMAKNIKVMFSAMGVPADVNVVDFFERFTDRPEYKNMLGDIDPNIRYSYNKVLDTIKKLKKSIERRAKDEIIKEYKREQGNLRININNIEAKAREEGRELNDFENATIKKIEEDIKAIDKNIEYYEKEDIPISEKLFEACNKIDSNYEDLYRLYRDLTGRDFEKVYDYWSNNGSEAEEHVSYHVTAKYMYMTKDPLWLEIVGDIDPDDIIDAADAGVEKLDNGKEVSLAINNFIAAVCAKYIQGHLFAKGSWSMGTLPEYERWVRRDFSPDEVEQKIRTEGVFSVYEYAKHHKIILLAETEQPEPGQEGRLRLMHADDHITLVKWSDNPLGYPEPPGVFAYNMDFEHLTTNLIDPIQDAQKIKPGDGKYIKMLHVNAPRPYVGAHAPIYMFSQDMEIIYEWMLILRQKGLKNAYIIWEMGSYGPQQSASAFRRLVEYLKKDTPINELPADFFGIDDSFIAQQRVAVHEHTFDPLDSMLNFSSEKHTFLKKQALEKNKLGDWIKEELR